jgi:LuxR family maltose regulon positive regulatory protein
VLLGVITRTSGDVRPMLARSSAARAAVARHGWEALTWSATGTAMIAHAALLRGDAPEAEHLAAEALTLYRGRLTPPARFALRVVHGAAAFDQGRRANGLAERHQARTELGGVAVGAEEAAAAAVLEFRAALHVGKP